MEALFEKVYAACMQACVHTPACDVADDAVCFMSYGISNLVYAPLWVVEIERLRGLLDKKDDELHKAELRCGIVLPSAIAVL